MARTHRCHLFKPLGLLLGVVVAEWLASQTPKQGTEFAPSLLAVAVPPPPGMKLTLLEMTRAVFCMKSMLFVGLVVTYLPDALLRLKHVLMENTRR